MTLTDPGCPSRAPGAHPRVSGGPGSHPDPCPDRRGDRSRPWLPSSRHPSPPPRSRWWLTALVARRRGTVSVVDITWGLVFVAIGWVSFVVGTGSGRSLLLAVLVTVWGGRLAWHIRRRALGAGEDPRYEALLAGAPPGKRFGYAVRKVFVVQGLAAWFVSLPLQVAAATDRPLGWIAAIGVVVWVVGLTFEGVGDAQLAAFKRDPANRGGVMDRGLWALDPAPELLRRRGRVVGPVAGRGRGLARGAHRALAGGDDLLPRLRDRGSAARVADGEAPGLRRVHGAHEHVLPAPPRRRSSPPSGTV